MVASNSDSGARQRVAPTTAYSVEGSPDDYEYFFRGADLVLVDQNNQEQVFLFVGNIMSLDGNVNMEFSNGQTLDGQSLFGRSEMQDMQNFDGEATEWEVQAEGESSGESGDNPIGNSDGTGYLPPEEQNDDVPAQAPEELDPTDELMKLQRSLINELSEKSGEDGLLATGITPDNSGGSSSETKKAAESPKETADPNADPGNGNGNNVPSGDKPTIRLMDATDSGLKGDSVTRNQNPDFEGNASADATVEIFVDNVLKDTVTADGNGYFSTNSVHGLNDGDYKIHVVSTDTGGAVSTSNTLDFAIDVTVPDIPTLELSIASNTGTVAGGGLYTNDTTPTLQGTGGDPDSTVTLYYSTNNWASETELATVNVGSDGSWGYTLTNVLIDDSYSFRITAKDHAYNLNSGSVYLNDVTVKTSNPTSSLSLATESDSGAVGDLLTNADTLTLNITPSADTASVEVVAPSGGTYVSLGQAVNVGGVWTFIVPHSAISADGSYTFLARATDIAGNVEAIQSKVGLVVAVDRTVPEVAPTIDLLAESDSTDSGGLLGTDHDNITNVGVLKFEGTIGGDNDGSVNTVKIFVSIDGAAEIELADSPTLKGVAGGHWTYELDLAAIGLSGSNDLEFTAKVFDAAGNVAESAMLPVAVDRDVPEIPTIELDGLLGTLDSGPLQDVATARNTGAVLKGIVTEGSDDIVLTLYQINSDNSRTVLANNMAGNGALGDITMTDNGNGTFTWSYDYGAIADGQEYSFVTTVEDKAGNFSSRESKTFVINADRTIGDPSIALDVSTDTEGGPGGTVGDNYTGYVGGLETNPLKINVSGDDNSTIKVYVVDTSVANAGDVTASGSVIGGTLVGTSVQDVNNDWPLVSYDASGHDNTTTNLTFVAVSTDAAGNISDEQFTMTLDDQSPGAGSIDLHVSDDLGVSATDNITNAKQIQLTGTLDEGASAVKVTIFDRATELGEATVTTVGGVHSWTYDIGNEASTNSAYHIATGDHSYTAVVEDNAGNQTTLTALSVTIDRDIAAPTFTLDSGSDSGVSDSDGITKAASLVFKGTSDVSATVVVRKVDAFGNDTEVTTFTAGSSNWNYTVLNSEIGSDGDYKFYVTTSDLAGNTKSSTPVDVTIDRSTNIPGAIDLTSDSDSFYLDGGFTGGTTNADNITNKDSVVLTGDVAQNTDVEPGSLVVLYIQGVVDPIDAVAVGDSDTTWSITVPKASIPDDVAYDFYVKYVDMAGNESAASADFEVSIDRGVPANPGIALNGVLDTDYFIHGGQIYTDEHAPTFALSNLEVGTTLNIKVDGVAVETHSVDATTYTFNPTAFASDGSDDQLHTVSVIAVDSAGNASAEVIYSFNLDTQADAISGVKLADGSNSASLLDSTTNIVTPEIVGKAEANSEVTVTIRNGGADVVSGMVTADATGSWSYPVTNDTLLTDGNTYTVVVSAEDYAGNVATDSSYNFTIDTNVDTVGFTMVETSMSDMEFALDDHITQNRNPEFSWTAHEDLTATISVFTGGGVLVKEYEVDSPAGAQTWNVPGGDSLADGNYVVKASFKDVAGNTVSTDAGGNPIEISLTVDNAPPSLSVNYGEATVYGGDNHWLINDENIDDGWQLNGTAEVGARLYVYVNDMANPIASGGNDYITIGAGGNWSFDLSALAVGSGINVGNNSIKVVAADAAGNKSTFTQTLEVDPDVNPVGDIMLHTDSDSGIKGDFITNDTTPTLTGSVERESTVMISQVVGGVATEIGAATVDVNGDWTFEVPAGTLTTDGDYTFRATITDRADNVATTERVISVDSNPAAPSITMSDDSEGTFFGTDSDFITNDTTPQFTVTTEVDTKLEVFMDGALVHTVVRASNNGDGVLTYNQPTLTEGSYSFRFLSTDSAGNTSEHTQVVKIDPQYDSADLTVALRTDYDSGSSDSDGLTNQNHPVFAGTAEAGSQLRIHMSERFATQAEADAATVPAGATYTLLEMGAAQTSWEHSPSTLATDGFYKLTVISEDEAGNQVTKTTVVELDTTPPDTPTFELTTDGESGPNENTIVSSTHTKDHTPGIRGTAEAGSDVIISVKEAGSDVVARQYTATADASGNWFYQVDSDESLDDGSYDVVISCTDDAGNTAEGTAEFMITGDTPVAPTISLDAVDDSNIDTDGVTFHNSGLTLTGIAQSHCDVDIYVTNAGDVNRTNGVLVTTVEAGGNGIWAATLAGTFTDGDYYYYAKSEYAVGGEFVSDLQMITVDTATLTPTLELVDDVSVADEWIDPSAGVGDEWRGPNTSATDWKTSDPTITGVVDEGATVRIQLINDETDTLVDTYIIEPGNLNEVGSDWTYTHAFSNLADGTYRITVFTKDLAGNEATSVERTLKLDSAMEKPTLDLPDAYDTELNVGAGGQILFPNGTPAGSANISHLPVDYVTSVTDGYTRHNSIPLSGHAEVGSRVRIDILKGADAFPSPEIFTVTDPSGNWTYNTGVLEDASYTFTVTTIDTAGNTKTGDPMSIYVDAAQTQGCAIDMWGDELHRGLTADATPGFTLYGDQDAVWMLYLDGGSDPVATGTFNDNSRYYYTANDLDANEAHSYRLVTVDRAGNVQMSSDFNFTIDTIAPVQQADPISVSGSSLEVPASGGEPLTIYTKENSPTLDIKVEAGTSVHINGFGQNDWFEDEDGNGIISFTLPGANLDQGVHTVSLMFRDDVENHDPNEDLTFKLIVDSKAPTTEISLKSSSDLGFSDSDRITSGDQLVLNGNIFKSGIGQAGGEYASDIATYSILVTNIDDGSTTTIDSPNITLNADGSWEATYGTDGVDLTSGNYKATLTAADLSGNTHSSTVTFTVDNDDAGIVVTPEASLQQIGNSGYYILQQDNYLPAGAEESHYKYELTFYGEDASGNAIQLTLPQSSFSTNGGIEELVTPTILSTYDHAGVRVVDHAGNETQSEFIDFDKSDVTFVSEVETSVEVDSVNVTITGDTDGDGLVDTTINGTAEVQADDSWSFNFANPLDAGDYTLHLEGLDSSDNPVSAAGASTYDFTVLANEMDMESDEQDFSVGDNVPGDTGGGGGAAPADTVEIEATVHVDYVEGNIS